MPSRKHLSNEPPHEKAEEIRNKVKEELKGSESVCLTADLWSN